jgi:hypothetical protein
MRIDMIVTFTLLLAASAAAHAQPDAEPAPPQDWIEVPPDEGTFREYPEGFRTDVIDIPLEPYEELEYKLALHEGDAIVYEWNALKIDDPEQLYSEFHGHTERVGGEPGTLMFYRKATGGSESGLLVAPFTGIHGWYLVNSSEDPIVVRLNVAGIYELVDE